MVRVTSVIDSTVRRTFPAIPKSALWVALGIACWAAVILGAIAIARLF
jgi:hypothetical protein